MKKIGIYIFIGAFSISLLFTACSKKEPQGQKKTGETITDKAAQTINDQLRAPIKRATEAAKKGEERVKGLEETTKEQK